MCLAGWSSLLLPGSGDQRGVLCCSTQGWVRQRWIRRKAVLLATPPSAPQGRPQSLLMHLKQLEIMCCSLKGLGGPALSHSSHGLSPHPREGGSLTNILMVSRDLEDTAPYLVHNFVCESHKHIRRLPRKKCLPETLTYVPSLFNLDRLQTRSTGVGT